MKKGSAYWLSHTPTEKFNLIELAHTQRAVSNFVKILTKKEIPVAFFEYKKAEMTMNHFQKMKDHKLKLIQDHDIKVYFDDNPFYVDYLRNKGILVFQQILSDQYIDEFSKKDKYFTCHFQRDQFDFIKKII